MFCVIPGAESLIQVHAHQVLVPVIRNPLSFPSICQEKKRRNDAKGKC
jgi:hypothetical protein